MPPMQSFRTMGFQLEQMLGPTTRWQPSSVPSPAEYLDREHNCWSLEHMKFKSAAGAPWKTISVHIRKATAWRSQALIWLPPGQDMQRRAWEIKKCALPASKVATAWQMPVGSCSLAQSCKALLLITFNFHMIGNFKRTRHVTDCPLSVAKFGPDRPDPQIQSRARSTHQSWRPRNWRWSFQRLSDLPHCSGDSVSTLLGCAVPKPWIRQLQGLKNIQHNPNRFPSHGGSTNDFNGKIQKQIISSARYESE